MSTPSKILLILALLLTSTFARSDGLSTIGGLNSGFTGGFNNFAAQTVVVGCASPTAPNGIVDLSQCSNAFYAAVIF
jgi:hypothetical protein